MSDSEYLECECEGLGHEKFNSILSIELRKNITVSDVFDRDYCVMLSVDLIDEDEGLSVHEHLTDLKGKMGVYGLWIELTECYDHDMHRMLCLYVGKGFALGRIKKHITERWPEQELLYVTFYECENRIAKYIEQLLLDKYDFPLNTGENSGEGFLATVWDDDRYSNGTHLHELSDRLAKKFPERFQ